MAKPGDLAAPLHLAALLRLDRRGPGWFALADGVDAYALIQPGGPLGLYLLRMHADACLGPELHPYHTEGWHVISGQAVATIAEVCLTLTSGTIASVERGVEHTLRAGAFGCDLIGVVSPDWSAPPPTRFGTPSGA